VKPAHAKDFNVTLYKLNAPASKAPTKVGCGFIDGQIIL
jgi:hypothetical protein